MRVLVIGSGGREHALAWKLSLSDRVTEVLVAPGNAGTALEAKVRNLEVDTNDFTGLIDRALAERVDFTLVGPEIPLVEGIVEALNRAWFRILVQCNLPCMLVQRLHQQ